MENSFNKKGLIQQYMDLEQEWDTIKRASTKKPRRTRSVTEPKTNMVRAIRALMDNSSPRELMSCLQQDMDRQKWEIIRERKAGFESRKIKGRRLFEGSEDDEGVEEKGSSPLPPSSFSSSSSTTNSSFLCDECMEMERERERELVGRREDGEKVASEARMVDGERRCSGGVYKYRWLVVATFWVAVGLLVGGVSGVFSSRKEYHRHLLIPT